MSEVDGTSIKVLNARHVGHLECLKDRGRLTHAESIKGGELAPMSDVQLSPLGEDGCLRVELEF